MNLTAGQMVKEESSPIKETKKLVPKLRFKEFNNTWTKEKIGEITNVTAGGTPSTLNGEYWGGEIRWMNSGELNLKRIYEVENRITKLGLDNSSTKLIPKRCILIGLAGQGKTRGTAAINYIELCTNQSIAAIFPNEKKFDSEFIYQNIDNRYDELRRLSTGDGGRGGLNLQIIKECKVPLTTIPEQQKIASFLSAVDEKIQQLTRKKELLEQYKKGVMQQIFSGKIRFKDEKGKDYPEWEEKYLNDIANFSKGKGISKIDTVENGKVECIRYGQLYTEYNECILDVASRTNLNGSLLVLSEENDVLIPSSGETQIDIAKACCILKSGVAIGGDINIIKPRIDGVFLAYYLNSVKRNEIAKMAQGNAVVHLYSSQLKSLRISFPSAREQRKIRDFLQKIEAQIININAAILLTKEFKKGLLQQMFV